MHAPHHAHVPTHQHHDTPGVWRAISSRSFHLSSSGTIDVILDGALFASFYKRHLARIVVWAVSGRLCQSKVPWTLSL